MNESDPRSDVHYLGSSEKETLDIQPVTTNHTSMYFHQV